MSDITPPSYIDDGRSFTRRLPVTSLTSVSHWHNTTHAPSDTTTTYTGSYIDDGLDLLPPLAPGFGSINPRFYKHKKRRDKDNGVWNDDIAQAISGDTQASLAKMRGIAGLEVKRPEISAQEEKKRREKRKGVVSVPAPPKWGTFVIKGDDGRVVVIDERGEFDSGAVRGGQQRMEANEGRRWVRAARSPSPPQCNLSPAQRTDTALQSSGKEKRPGSRRDSKTKTYSRTSSHRPKLLTPILESDYSSDDPVKISTASPTDFFMTGGLSGWPSRTASPDSAPIVLHAITWETTSPPLSHDKRSASKSKSKSRQHSSHLLSHGWPCSPASPTRSACSSSFANPKERRPSRRSSKSSRRTRRDQFDHEDLEIKSNYQPPNIVEVIYDETPPEVSYSQAGWGDVKTVSMRSWGDGRKDGKSEAPTWEGVADAGTVKSFGQGSAVSNLGWGGSAKGSGWDLSKAGSNPGSVHGWDNDEKHSDNGDNSDGEWDGFERPKTASEVSVAGSASERSWPASHHSSLTHRTRRSHTSHKSSRRSPTDWPASQANSKAGSAVQWGGSAIQSEHNWPTSAHGSEHSWTKSKHGSEKSSPAKYQNVFDEDNATYLNETWGGIPVRVASPHKSVAGWD